jgi:hypothetical protein
MSLMAISFALVFASSALEQSDTNRLEVGSLWQCKHFLNEENSPDGDLYEANFLIAATENKTLLPTLPKQLIVKKTSGELPMQFTAYGSANATKNPFGRAGFRKKYDFVHDFNDWGAFVTIGWWKRNPDIELIIHSFNYEFREDPSKRDERSFVFQCLKVIKQ